jgi:hypothetical protein
MRGIAPRLALVLAVLGGPALAEADFAGLAAKIGRHWNIGVADADTLAGKVVVRVSFAPDGTPTDFALVGSEGPSREAIDLLFAAARRAVLRAHADGGLPLSAAEYETWQVIDLVFDAKGMPSS